MLPRLRRKVHDKFGSCKSKEVFEKPTYFQQLHKLEREYLGEKDH
jgi:hypothetical protein